MRTKKIQPDVLLGARLYPDMLPFTKQIQLVTDFAAKGCARLTHSEVPSTPDTEKTFGELRQRLAKTIDYVKSFKPAQFEGADTKDVTFPAGPDRSMTMKGQQFLKRVLVSEFLFPCGHRPWHFTPQWRGNRQARFPRGVVTRTVTHSGPPSKSAVADLDNQKDRTRVDPQFDAASPENGDARLTPARPEWLSTCARRRNAQL